MIDVSVVITSILVVFICLLRILPTDWSVARRDFKLWFRVTVLRKPRYPPIPPGDSVMGGSHGSSD